MKLHEKINIFVECLDDGLSPILDAMLEAIDQADNIFANGGVITELEIQDYTFHINHVYMKDFDQDLLSLEYHMLLVDFEQMKQQCAAKAQLSLEEIDAFYKTNSRTAAFQEPVRSAEEEVFEWIHYNSDIVIDQENGKLIFSNLLEF